MLKRFSLNFAIFSMIIDGLTVALVLWGVGQVRLPYPTDAESVSARTRAADRDIRAGAGSRPTAYRPA